MSYIFPPPDQNLNLHNNHPLIERKDNYLLDRKLLTIHSEDRDYSKWPTANEFEIECPQSYTNIQSMRLTEMSLPCNYYNFSNNLQNTKFKIILLTSNKEYIIDISNGYYTNIQLAATLTYQLNNIILGNPMPKPDSTWQAVYHEVKEKILIGNNMGEEFILDASYDHDYKILCTPMQGVRGRLQQFDPSGSEIEPSVNYFNRYNKFGLLSYIGYTQKIKYHSIESDKPLYLDYANSCGCQDFIWLNKDNKKIYWIEPPKIIDILGESCIYMELDYFNTYDELIPWPDTSGNTFCSPINARSANDVINCGKNTNVLWKGRSSRNYPNPNPPPGPAQTKYVAERGSGINSAFAKIPIISVPKTQIFSSTNGFLFNLSQYDPPIERISKMKFKFRYHDGRLVDFQENDFNFTIEINQLRNEIKRNMNIRMPQLYNLS
jgi:hypothetical protein